MASYLGIDIGHSAVRAVLVRTSYRRITLEGMGSCELGGAVDLAEAIRTAAGGLALRCDGVSVSLPGEQLFVRRLEIPATAAKQLSEVVPFEIEAQLPFDMSDAVFDFKALPRERGADKIDVFASVARTDDVRARIELLQASIGHEPELVIPGAFSLAALIPQVPELAEAATLCLLDIGATRTEILVAVKGEVMYARTLSVGTNRLPESAQVLGRELRQTLSAWRAAGGGLIDAMYLAGGGSQVAGADVFLSGALGVQVLPMPMPKIEGITPEQAAQVPVFAKALGLALTLQARGRLLNLRQGPLTFERGYGFLREKIPVLAGLAVVIVVSSLFATWAEMRALSNEREVLENALALVSKEVLGEETRDAARARELVEQGPGGKDEDPLPQADSFDVLYQLAEAVGPEIKHDLEEVDVQRAGQNSTPKVTLHGVVPKVQDAEDLTVLLKTYPCFQDVKLGKTSQQIGGEGQKYLMDFDLKCVSPDAKKKAAPGSSASAAAAASARGDK
jgi:general secretion pathway protein L